MKGLGGLNKSDNGVVIGLVQLKLPVVEAPDHLASRPAGLSIRSARRGTDTVDLVVFPDYAPTLTEAAA